MTTTVTAEEAAERIGTKDVAAVARILPRAVALVDDALTGAFRECPDLVREEMVLSVAYALWDRKKSSHGIAQSTVMEGGTPVRSPRDPLASIRSMLSEYVAGFA